MAEKKVTRSIQNIADISLAVIENDIEYLLFVDNAEIFSMETYTKLQPVITGLAKLVLLHADTAAKKMQDETVHKVANRLKDEVTRIVYDAKVPVTETISVTETEVEPHNDW